MEQKLSCRDWTIMFTLPCMIMFSSYDNFGIAGLLPLVRDEFNLTDSQAASLKTYSAAAHAVAYASLWLFGDFLPRKASYLVSASMWICSSFASVFANSEQFWLYLLLRSFQSMFFEVFRILVNVLQAEHFSGKYLTIALTANMIGESLATLFSSSINSIFVANNSEWRVALMIGPGLAAPVLITSAIFLHKSARTSIPHPISILKNAIGVLKIPSVLLLTISQCLTMFYSLSLFFWMPSIMLYSYEVHPDVFLGLSYPVISSIQAVVSSAGLFSGAFLMPYLSQSLASGALCGSLPPTALAIPLVYLASSVLETLSYIGEVATITRSFPLFVIAYFIDGLAGSGIALYNLQIVLTTSPSIQRASSLSLFKMCVEFGVMPSSQLIGAISDYFRGDSTDTLGHLDALQSAFLYTWFLPVASTLLCLVMLRYYKRDAQRARDIDSRDNEERLLLITEKENIETFQ